MSIMYQWFVMTACAYINMHTCQDRCKRKSTLLMYHKHECSHTHTVSCCFSLHCWRHMGVRMHVCTGVLATREITNRCDTVSGSGFEVGLWMCLSYLSFLCLFRWFGVIFHIHHIVGSLIHGALTPLPQSRPSIRGRPQCSVMPPHTHPPGGTGLPPASATIYHCYLAKPGESRKQRAD